MKLLIDAQLSPSIAAWINTNYPSYHAESVWAAGLQEQNDLFIYEYAKQNGFVIVSKDSDFRMLIDRFGCPPHLIWITMGNTSNEVMRKSLEESLNKLVDMIKLGESIVELSDRFIPLD